MRPIADDRDRAIVAERAAALDAIEGPRVGDYVEFANGVTRRISHVWDFQDGSTVTVQTSAGGSYYLGHGYVSFSGSLYRAVSAETLTRTGEERDGDVWLFHHDCAQAHNGVNLSIAFRVYRSSVEAPT